MPSTSRALLISLIASLLALSSLLGCKSGPEPAPESAPRPVEGALAEAEIAGYCPVAYVESDKPIKGSPQHAVTHQGRTYWFVDQGAKRLYEEHPERYQVNYRGWDATAMARGERVRADPEVFAVHGGEVYLFADESSREAFLARPEELRERADARWPELARSS